MLLACHDINQGSCRLLRLDVVLDGSNIAARPGAPRRARDGNIPEQIRITCHGDRIAQPMVVGLASSMCPFHAPSMAGGTSHGQPVMQ